MNDVADPRSNLRRSDKRETAPVLSRVKLSVAAAAGALMLSVSPLSADQHDSAAWFTEEQASRGNSVFVTECGGCHGYSMTQVLEESDTAEDFYTYISNNMPWENPGSLASQQYADIVAFFLGELGFPAGDTELPPDRQIMAQIVPSNAGAVQDDPADVEQSSEGVGPESDTTEETQTPISDNAAQDETTETEAATEEEAAEGGAAPVPSEADGAFYTAEQAEQGRRDFAISCGGCHGGEMVGDFQTYATAADFYSFISSAMPADAPGSLAPAQYTAIIAYLLGESGFPAGETELTNDMEVLGQILPSEAPTN